MKVTGLFLAGDVIFLFWPVSVLSFWKACLVFMVLNSSSSFSLYLSLALKM